MPTQTIRPNGVVEIGEFGPAASGDFDSVAQAATNLSDEDTGTKVVNQSTNQTIKLAMENLTDDSIDEITQLQVTVGVHTGGKGSAAFSVQLLKSNGDAIATAEDLGASTSTVSNEATGTAITGLSLSQADVDGIVAVLTTDATTQSFFTELLIICTYDRVVASTDTAIVGDTGKITINLGRVEIQNGKVEL